MLRHRTIEEAAWEFNALCEGFASLELRGAFPVNQEEQAWRSALTTLVNGMVASPPT